MSASPLLTGARSVVRWAAPDRPERPAAGLIGHFDERTDIMKTPAMLLLGFISLGAQSSFGQSASGWVELFNGKDLTGWRNNGAEKWVVEDGTILCESTAGEKGEPTTGKKFLGFKLPPRLKREASGNNGGVFLPPASRLQP